MGLWCACALVAAALPTGRFLTPLPPTPPQRLCPGAPHTGTLQNKAVNGIHWSPNGHNIVLSGLKALNGQLEFFNVDEFEILAAAEHFMATNVEWDPTGVCFGGGAGGHWD